MKKFTFLFMTAVLGLGFSAKAANDTQGPTIDAGIGIGVYDKGESTGASFTQRIGAEWDVAKFHENFSVSAGMYISNSYGRSTTVIETPWLDKEIDELDYRLTRDDISILPTASLRYKCASNLEAYFSLGLGMGILHASGSLKFDADDNPDEYWYADELNESATKTCFAMTTCLGLRYFINTNWGVNAQFGMIAGNLKKGANSFNIFSVGASYRF